MPSVQNGGGRMPSLTADLAARAVIAAAASMGEDPIAALTGPTQKLRRVRMAAAAGLQVAGVCTLTAGAIALNVHVVSVSRARNAEASDFDRAEAAAAAAAGWALKAEAERAAEVAARVPAPAPPPVRHSDMAVRPPVTVEAPLRDRLTEVLRLGPQTPPSLAILCDAKELDVTRALSALEHEGRVVGLPVPEAGRRQQPWALSAEVAGA